MNREAKHNGGDIVRAQCLAAMRDRGPRALIQVEAGALLALIEATERLQAAMRPAPPGSPR